jgi:hypothetical protein
MKRIAAINQIELASRTCTVIASELVLTYPAQSHFGDPHQIPDTDNHLGMTDQKAIHIWIAFDGLCWHSPKITYVLHHGSNPLASLRS